MEILKRVVAEHRPNALYYVVYHSCNDGEDWSEDFAWFWTDAPEWVRLNLENTWVLGAHIS